MALSLLFFRRNSIFHMRFFLSGLLYLTLVNLKYSSVCHYLVFANNYLVFANFFGCQKNTQKKIFISKVASHILCPSFVSKLPHECEDITKNAWRAPLNAQCRLISNINYKILYSF